MLVVRDPVSGALARLGGTALAVWDHLDGVHRSAEVVAELASKFGAPEDAVRRDVEGLLAQLLGLGLVRNVSG